MTFLTTWSHWIFREKAILMSVQDFVQSWSILLTLNFFVNCLQLLLQHVLTRNNLHCTLFSQPRSLGNFQGWIITRGNCRNQHLSANFSLKLWFFQKYLGPRSTNCGISFKNLAISFKSCLALNPDWTSLSVFTSYHHLISETRKMFQTVKN